MNELIQEVIAAAREIKRGCDCEYDYRCGNCERIVSLCEAVEKMNAHPNAAAKPVHDAPIWESGVPAPRDQMPEGVSISPSKVSNRHVYVMAYHVTMLPDQARAIARELNSVADQVEAISGPIETYSLPWKEK